MGVQLTTHLHLVPKFRMSVELYLYSIFGFFDGVDVASFTFFFALLVIVAVLIVQNSALFAVSTEIILIAGRTEMHCVECYQSFGYSYCLLKTDINIKLP